MEAKDKNIESALSKFLKNGDLDSLSLIYEKYFNILFIYGQGFNIEYQIIEDAIQNIFLTLIRSRRKLKHVTNFESYLFMSFRNELFRLAAKQKKLNIDIQKEGIKSEASSDFEEELFKKESDNLTDQILRTCFAKLTQQQKAIIGMKFYLGKSYKDISSLMEINIESCRTAVYRAVKSLKKEIDKYKNINRL